jgi:hypothetical protein
MATPPNPTWPSSRAASPRRTSPPSARSLTRWRRHWSLCRVVSTATFLCEHQNQPCAQRFQSLASDEFSISKKKNCNWGPLTELRCAARPVYDEHDRSSPHTPTRTITIHSVAHTPPSVSSCTVAKRVVPSRRRLCRRRSFGERRLVEGGVVVGSVLRHLAMRVATAERQRRKSESGADRTRQTRETTVVGARVQCQRKAPLFCGRAVGGGTTAKAGTKVVTVTHLASASWLAVPFEILLHFQTLLPVIPESTRKQQCAVSWIHTWIQLDTYLQIHGHARAHTQKNKNDSTAPLLRLPAFTIVPQQHARSTAPLTQHRSLTSRSRTFPSAPPVLWPPAGSSPRRGCRQQPF